MQAQGAGQASSAASRQAGVAQAAGQASSATSRRMGPGATRDQQPASSAGVARQSMSCMEKYRGIAPKKSLVSKDHEHAYFDSADWVDLSMIIKRKKTICTNQFIMPVCTNRFIMYACTNQFYNVDARKNSELKERTQQFLPLQQLHSMFSNKDTTPRRTM
ncbi:hypothetical protein ZEAMMB73_Zm00001d046036 [Zea mays]|uniref:Uncharacterized protein n=1 Tax=Zea mays TaxID=4577 RepID=A0A1D6P0H6_MAIZE|nr:hypothetical protein ZEAMMB73_Zm00001d046036 [Zea mays]